jgi:hypothetical protein
MNTVSKITTMGLLLLFGLFHFTTRSNAMELFNDFTVAPIIDNDSISQQAENKVEICISKINVLRIKFPKIPLIDFWHVCIKTQDGNCIGFYPKEQSFMGLVKATLIRVAGVVEVGEPERCFTTRYDPNTMQEAINNTQKRYGHYNLFFKNCQHFVADAIAEYYRLNKRKK